MTCLIASNGVYALVVMAPPNECFADLPKYFFEKFMPGEKVTPSVNKSGIPVVVEWSLVSITAKVKNGSPCRM